MRSAFNYAYVTLFSDFLYKDVLWLLVRIALLCQDNSNEYPQHVFSKEVHGVVGWCEGAVYLTSLGRPTDIGLQLGKACYPCSG